MPNVYGRLPHTRDTRDFQVVRFATTYSGAFVNLEGAMSPVWDQGNLGSCVSHGTAAAMAYALRHENATAIDPSRLFHYYAARLRAGLDVTQDTGMEIRDGFASLAKDGIPAGMDWPYEISKFAVRPPAGAWNDAKANEGTVYGAVPSGSIDDTIASGYPVVIGFDVYESFESDTTASSGVMPVPGRDERQVGGHCVVLVSTPRLGDDIPGGVPGRKYRRARNSWGTGWGDLGYFWFPLDAMEHASDFWQVTTISTPTPVPPTPAPAPAPGPGPDAQSVAFAAALRKNGWVTARHVQDNRRVAHAAQVWLAAEGL